MLVKDQLTSFCEKLGTQLRQCLKFNHKKFDRDTTWGLYHQLRTSEGFVKDWSQLFNDSAGNLYPFFYQHVTDVIFTELIKFEVSQISDDTVEDVTPNCQLWNRTHYDIYAGMFAEKSVNALIQLQQKKRLI